jgi:AcrR family transcriptional regulator
MSRLTRKEMQAKTRRLLMEAAGKVCSKRGLQHASIDEVAETAGFTKGAFYANFKSKEELFLSMLDERFGERLQELDRLAQEPSEPVAQAREAGLQFARFVGADPEWQRLFFEFSAYAARNEDFRQELVTRYRALRERIAAIYAARAEELGSELPVPVEQLALMTFAMANGVSLEKLLEPDTVPDDLFATMLSIFVTGLGALAADESSLAPGR